MISEALAKWPTEQAMSVWLMVYVALVGMMVVRF
jgi:hypothetical protein